MGRVHFIFRPVLFGCTVAAIILLCTLGHWQFERLAWKRDLISLTDTRLAMQPVAFRDIFTAWQAGKDVAFRPVLLTGMFDHEGEIHVHGVVQGRAGWYVMTPMTLVSGEVIYVNRGFVDGAFKAQTSRPESLVTGHVQVIGLFRPPAPVPMIAKMFQPNNNPGKNEWYERNPLHYAASARNDALPVLVDSLDAGGANGPKGRMASVGWRNHHLQYAITWYGLAVILLLIYSLFSLRRSVR